MFIPKARPRPQKSVYKERSVPAFGRFLRRRHCAVQGCMHADVVQAHIRCDLPADAEKGGTGIKPADRYSIPLCNEHHMEQHRIGERTFYEKYKILALELAAALWETWLHTTEPGQRYRRDHQPFPGA